MRVLHIMAGRGLGGAETYSVDMMLSLHKAGVDQCVVISRHAPGFKKMVDAGMRVAPQVLDWRFIPLQRFLLNRLIKREMPDLIHCWMRRAASIMPKKLPCADVPVIGWFGGYYNPKNFKACSDFVGVTREIVVHMIKNGVPGERANFVPTFPSIEYMPPVNRAALDTPQDVPVLLALSRLHPKKGLDTLMHALRLVPGAYLWIAGDGPLRKELELVAKKLEVADRIRFLGWRDDRAALLSAADVCVLPSRYEPFGTVILEAWAAKVPFVACASAGPAAHVDNNLNGLLVPIDDHEALAKAIARVIDDKGLRENLIEGGYKSYTDAYTREAVTKQMLMLYIRLIGRNLNRDK